MGCVALQKSEYKNVKTTLNFIAPEASHYGTFLASIIIHDPSYEDYSKEKKEWYKQERQIIIDFLNVTDVSKVGKESSSLVFPFEIKFSKESVASFQKCFFMHFDYNNFRAGFKGIFELKNIKNCYLSPAQEKTEINFFGNEVVKAEIRYAIVGKQILDDLKKLELPGLTQQEQIVALQNALDFSHKSSVEIISKLHSDQLDEFVRHDALENLLKGGKKASYNSIKKYIDEMLRKIENTAREKEFAEERKEDNKMEENSSVLKFSSTSKIFEFLDFKILSEFFRVHKEFKNNYLEALRIFIKKGGFERILKVDDIFEDTLHIWKEQPSIRPHYIDYFTSDAKKNPTKIENFINKGLFLEELIKPGFEQPNLDLIDLFLYFFKNLPNVFQPYFFKIKDEFDLEKLKENNNFYYFFKNLIETPDFKMLPFKLNNFFGEERTSEYKNVEGILKNNDIFSTPNGERNNFSLIAELENSLTFTVTHFYLNSTSSNDRNGVKSVLYLISDTQPTIDSIRKFHDFTKEKFDNNEFPEEDNLKPVGFIEVENDKAYQEIKLEEPVIAKYLVCLMIRTRQQWEKMTLQGVGAFGFEGDKREKGNEVEGGGMRIGIGLKKY